MIASQDNKILNTIQFEELLIYFSNAIYTKNNEDEILWDLAKNCIAKLGFVDCVVYLLDTERNVLVQKAAYGPKNPKDYEIYQPAIIPLGEGICGYVAKTGKAEIITDTSKDKRYVVDDEERFSEITVPIILQNEVIGVIDCEHPEKNYFTEQHLRILSAVASICSVKINSLRIQNKINEEREKTMTIREEVLQLKLQAIRSQLNPHFIFNALNAIQFFITSEKKVETLKYVSVFSKLIRFYLNQIDRDTVLLSEEIKMLDGYFKLQKLRYGKKFNYQINQNEKPPEAIIPSFLLQSLFENCIEHAIYNQYLKYSITFDFQIKGKQVVLPIQLQYQTPNNHKITYTPAYRKNLMKWEDQIALLNTAMGYNIKKDVTFIENNEVHKEMIVLTLPNLV